MEGQDVTDSTPRRSRRATVRASLHGGPAAQLQLSADERSAATRLHAAIRATYDLYDRQQGVKRRAVR